MSYHQYIPKESFYTNILQSFWQVSHATAFHYETIIPKGVLEVIFNFSEGNPVTATINGNARTLPACFISGFSTRPIQVKLPQRQVFFGVLFQPFAVQKIFGMPAGELADCTVDLTLVDAGFQFLWEELACAQHFDQRIALLLKWLHKYLFVPQPREQFIHHFLSASIPHHHSVNTLARELCYSPRQLSRKITAATGMNTETILLYKKYLHALQLIHHTPLSLTEVAYQCQFADQSHFIKSFRGFTQLTPGEYRLHKSPLMAHLYKDVR